MNIINFRWQMFNFHMLINIFDTSCPSPGTHLLDVSSTCKTLADAESTELLYIFGDETGLE